MPAGRKLLASLCCLPAEREVSQIIVGSDDSFWQNVVSVERPYLNYWKEDKD